MSDHFSGPAVMTDPSVDITDFYAFPSPERPGNLVLIMNVFPLATEHAYFSDVVNYRFRLRSLSQNGSVTSHGTAEHVIDVAFDDLQGGNSKQTGSVTTSNGYSVARPSARSYTTYCRSSTVVATTGNRAYWKRCRWC